MTPDLRRGDVEPLAKAPKLSKRKRTRRAIRQVSEKRREQFDLHAELRRRVRDRDGGCVLAGETDRDCVGRDTVHHRRKASAGGVWSMENLVCLCWGHNTDIEDRPAFYRERWSWLIVREGDEDWNRLGAGGG